MDSKVDFAAGGIVLIDNKVLLVKNRLRKEYKEYYDSGFWGYKLELTIPFNPNSVISNIVKVPVAKYNETIPISNKAPEVNVKIKNFIAE